MGTLRLILALLVVLSHMNCAVFGHNIGAFAVVIFFLMSGYVMTALISKYYGHVEDFPIFMLDRALRLFPQFLFYLCVALIVISAFHVKSEYLENINAWTILLNALMLPLGLYMYWIPSALILPQTWTLGLELMFYAVFPFILVYKVRPIACALSMIVFALAVFALIPPDYFAYRLLPGTLFIFLCGSFIRTRDRRSLLIVWVVSVVILLAFFGLYHGERVGHNTEVLLGTIIGIPLIWFLSKLPFHPVDETLGNISYGVYVNHFVFLMLADAYHFDSSTWPNRAVIMLASIAAAWLSYYVVERPAIRLRHMVRSSRTDRDALPDFPARSKP